MTIIEDTIRHYPKYAKDGYCWCLNKSNSDLPTLNYDQILTSMNHMWASKVFVGYGLPAYWENNYEDPNMTPVFIKVMKPEFLQSLGYVKDTGYVASLDLHLKKIPIESRFDILDIR